jgi:putative transposase
VRFAFIAAEKAHFPVTKLCRLLEVSRSGYYAWRQRKPSQRARRDRQLSAKVRVVHATNGGCYGSPRVYRELKAEGEQVSRKRVARLMRDQGLVGRQRRRFRKTTDSNHQELIAPNLVNRRFEAEGPNQLWAADITYVRTWEGWLYLAVVLDLYSRRVVGWATADHLRTELALEALRKAWLIRRPPKGLVHHSDRGVQYASNDYRSELERNGAVSSMSRRGDCWDNAVVESFFSTLKQELVYRRPWPTLASARRGIGDYIDGFYNVRRLHSTLGYLSPLDYELAVGLNKAVA